MPRNNSKKRREARKKAATDRQQDREKRTTTDQLLVMRTRPGNSEKERNRLLPLSDGGKKGKAKSATA